MKYVCLNSNNEIELWNWNGNKSTITIPFHSYHIVKVDRYGQAYLKPKIKFLKYKIDTKKYIAITFPYKKFNRELLGPL